MENRDGAAALFEHRKISLFSTEKAPFFPKVKIEIGTKKPDIFPLNFMICTF